MAAAALDAGADLVNDVSGFSFDPGLASLVARRGVPAVLMHLRGEFATMHRDPSYVDVMAEVVSELRQALARAEAAGVAPSQVILDPGIGFSKAAPHSLEVIRRLPEMALLDRPVLAGPSRKSFIGRVLELPVGERLMGTAAAVAACVLGGAHIVRVHDVGADAAGRADVRRDPRGACGMIARLASWFASVEPSWLDLVDILIVAFLIYQLLQFIRGTHAVQMALGALVLVLLYWLSQLLHLETVNWLLRTFMPYLVFGIIVVFQAEIRKVLAQLGKTPLPGVFGSPRTEEVIDEVVLAATTLAAQRTGAIVVIERDMGLRSYIETGIALDAYVTYDLLISIFNPGTPLHDGAVIVQGNRVAAAACFLPLTVNPQLSRELGSRHRAAIGVTEDTDALAVVVSEETGVISLVVGGRIRRELDAASLKAALLDVLEVEQAPEAPATPSPGLPARDK